MPNTTKGLPYPVSTDPVSEGAANIQALAEAVDARLPSSVGSLPAAPYDGQQTVLMLGSSPYTFLGLVYDSTAGRWISETVQRPLWYSNAAVAMNDIIALTTAGAAFADPIPYKVFTDAGLTLQVKLTIQVVQISSKTIQIQTGIQTTNLGADYGGVQWLALTAGATVPVGSAAIYVTTGWQDAAGITVRDYWTPSVGAYRQSGGTGINFTLSRPGIEYRWTKVA